jgi:hypothetical protein
MTAAERQRRHRGREGRRPTQRGRATRIQSSHRHSDRGLDPYFTPPEAVAALLAIEQGKIPHRLWEPAAGDGAIVRPLRAAGFDVVASDLVDYGGPNGANEGVTPGVNYLGAKRPGRVAGIVTNPPYRLALEFARKAVGEVPYVALLLRTNFLESSARLPFFREHGPTRIWISSRRPPMMHRFDWSRPQAASNTCFAWFVWQAGAPREPLAWFDWQECRLSGVG